jgi:hypothetical protein
MGGKGNYPKKKKKKINPKTSNKIQSMPQEQRQQEIDPKISYLVAERRGNTRTDYNVLLFSRKKHYMYNIS